MKELDSKFFEGFAKEAAAVGIPDDRIPALFDLSMTMELLTKDAAFRDGFEAQLVKAGYMPDPNGKRDSFWAGAGNLLKDTVSGLVPGLNMIRGHGFRKQLQQANDPMNVANKYNKQRQDWMQQRQQKDQMYGMGPGGPGGWPRPGFAGGYGYGVPQRWVSGYGEPGWY